MNIGLIAAMVIGFIVIIVIVVIVLWKCGRPKIPSKIKYLEQLQNERLLTKKDVKESMDPAQDDAQAQNGSVIPDPEKASAPPSIDSKKETIEQVAEPVVTGNKSIKESQLSSNVKSNKHSDMAPKDLPPPPKTPPPPPKKPRLKEKTPVKETDDLELSSLSEKEKTPVKEIGNLKHSSSSKNEKKPVKETDDSDLSSSSEKKKTPAKGNDDLYLSSSSDIWL